MSKHILLCDDEIHILRAAEFKLQRAGYRTQIAHDGEEAWAAIQQERPDLLISDCQMPQLDGLGLVQRLREHSATRDLPVVMLTAKALELSFEQLAQRWNVLQIVHKPFSPRELLTLVDNILQDGVRPTAADGMPIPSPVATFHADAPDFHLPASSFA